MFNFKTAKVIGMPNGLAWSQVHEFKGDGEKLAKRGQLLVILTLKEVGEGIEAVAAGREVLARINEEYYGNLEGKPFERLQATLKKLDKEVNNLELVVVAFYQDVGYFGILGGGKVVIKRGSKVQTILELGPDGRQGNTKSQNNTETLKILVGSGFIEEGDVFLLGSKKFFDEVAEGTWQAALGSGEPEEMVEILAPIVAGREKVGGVAGLVVKITGKTEPRIESIVTEDTETKVPLVSVASGVTPIEKKTSSVLPQRAQRAPQRLIFMFSVIRRLFGKLIRFRPKPVFIKRRVDQQERRKTLLTVAVILIFLLLVSVVLGTRKRVVERRQAEVEEIITQIESKLDEAKGLSVLKPSEAKRFLQEAQGLLDESSKFEVRPPAGGSRFEVLRGEIEAELAKVVREFKLTEPPVFLDLSLVKEGTRGDDLGLFKNNLVVLDKEGKRVIRIDIDNKSAKILAGGENLVGASRVAVYDQKTYTLAEKGVLETKADKTNLVIEKDEKWGKIVDFGTWVGNLYLLDKDKNIIWRYLVTETGFGIGQNWFKGTSVDLSKATGIAIDGSIWVARKNESVSVLKFTSGVQDKFSITGLEKPPTSPMRIYTDEEVDNLYVLDKDNYRVVVLDKEGNYQASYLWAGIGDVEDMVVSEKQKRIFLLAGNKIYEIEIK